jgi:hypothetical protein
MSFPIYKFRFHHKTEPEKTIVFLYRMFRDELEAESFRRDGAEDKYWDGMSEEKKEERTRSDYEFEMRYSHHETWCQMWFSHYTFRDRFVDPADAVADFEEYVFRVTRNQACLPDYVSSEDIQKYEASTGRKYICLMGAEDRWRWRGGTEDSPAPCMCQACVDNNRWVISH